MEAQIANTVLLIVSFLSIAVFSSMILSKISFPYTIGLVLVGGILGVFSLYYDSLAMFRNVELSPGMILYIILPILIYDAAVNINANLLWKNIVPILLLAVFGLFISALTIGYGVSYITDLTLINALVFGALISATDPVAVIALFNEVGAPRRLTTLIDGESIFNDATAIVLFTIVVGIATGESAGGVSIAGAVMSFFSVLLGGVLVGAIIGIIGSFVSGLGRNNLLLQITVSLIIAYVSFVVSDYIFHFSGVMSTLVAGIIVTVRSEKTIKPSNVETLEHFWDYFSFVANSLVFLLLGVTEVNIFRNTKNMKEVITMMGYVIPIVIVARVFAIYVLIPLYNKFVKENNHISSAYQAILFWGGLRGAVPVALVLAIPESLPQRELIIHFTFGFILFTLLFQGTTIKALMNKLGVHPENSYFDDKEGVSEKFDFNNLGLAQLIMKALHDFFDEEGFFIKEKITTDGVDYLLKSRKTMFHVIQERGVVLLTTEPKDLSYFKTVLYEALLELDEAVESIKSITNPKKINELMKNDDKLNSTEKISFDIMKYLSPYRMLVNVSSKSKTDIIRELVQQVVEVGAIPSDKFELILEDVINREKKMSTGLGGGVAIPHARTEYVFKIVVLLALVPQGIDFESIDGKPVNFLVLILSPKNESGPHLKVLSNISKLLSDETVRSELLKSKNPEELYNNIKSIVRQDK